MPLSAPDISTLSRLLDEALDLPPMALGPFLAALSTPERHLAPLLREMVLRHRSKTAAGYLAEGPRLDGAANDEVAARAGDAVGPYRLLREIGRGGMASVWLSERFDGVVKRAVALKMPLLSLTTPAQIERFERERDLLALLNHPQIARLYDAGVAASGQPYIVLEHVDGRPITEACDAQRLDLRARLQTFLQVLAAVDHAHRHLVVHRDIKPSNVFLAPQGDVKLLDFGVAKLLTPLAGGKGSHLAGHHEAGSASPLTREAGCALTPRYAAPEQLARHPVSTATDIYSLGVLLHELLTGELPHAGERLSVAASLEASLHDDALPPSDASFGNVAASHRGLPSAARLRGMLAGDLDTIVMKALRNLPGERYASVERFADDIRHWLASRPIAARRPTPAYRLRLFLRRHRPAAWAAAVGSVVAIVLAVLLGQQAGVALNQQVRADAVREFMMDMVEDAQADEHHSGGEITGRQMIASALSRAHQRFSGQPRLLGEVLGELGRMFLLFDDDTRAGQALAQSEALLSGHAMPGDPALNKTRVSLAQMALARNELPRAYALAKDARAACQGAGTECAKARFYASIVVANVDARAGRQAEALAGVREGVADSVRGFGATHAETAMAWQRLAVFARNAGDLQEAQRAIQAAGQVAGQTVLRAHDRIELARTQAVLALDLGHFRAASEQLQVLLARTTERDERALQLRLLANAELALGDADAALGASAQAIALADTASGDPEIWFARQAHARALSQLDRGDAALAEMRSVATGLAAAGYAPGTLPMLRAHRVTAELLARHGELEAAWSETELVRLASAPQQAAPGVGLELGQALDLQGWVMRERQRPEQALELHRQARALLAAQLPAEHPVLLRNARYLAQAEAGLAAASGPELASAGACSTAAAPQPTEAPAHHPCPLL